MWQLPEREGDYLLGVGDVIERLTVRGKDGGTVAPSYWTVTHNVCPEGKMTFGRACYWWESEFTAWLETRKGAGKKGPRAA
jgi:hypothetical protein